ncbi:hypothetical protein C8D87_101663 [Lentzea atacamensis]|uniref:Uncharacterized protein n=1 Tax=Lentzea atacamensis TaxID=531938 RepID=A0ABX9EHJ8_9PSEU|nr:hypothetical protein [Lentzea atacamensis]RAS70363.1 hypothetical protein C8D87_101663 [Lentzea atacamensis]
MANTASSARAEVTLRSKTMVLDFHGECRVERAGDSVRLSGMRLVAELPDAGGPEDGGTVLLEQDGEALTATVAQPGGKVELTTRSPVPWSGSGRDVEPAGEIFFVLPDAPESTVLSIRGLVLREAT